MDDSRAICCIRGLNVVIDVALRRTDSTKCSRCDRVLDVGREGYNRVNTVGSKGRDGQPCLRIFPIEFPINSGIRESSGRDGDGDTARELSRCATYRSALILYTDGDGDGDRSGYRIENRAANVTKDFT